MFIKQFVKICKIVEKKARKAGLKKIILGKN